MPDNGAPALYAGDGPEDRRLWFAYFQGAGEPILRRRPNWRHPKYDEVSDPKHDAEPDLIAALQAIVFSVFVVEYRMKRCCHVLGATIPPGKMLGWLVRNFWSVVGAVQNHKKTGLCKKPSDWTPQFQIDLEDFVDRRNRIGHANWVELIAMLRGKDELSFAKEQHNFAVDVVKLINWGTKYTNEQSKSADYWHWWKVFGPGDSITP